MRHVSNLRITIEVSHESNLKYPGMLNTEVVFEFLVVLAPKNVVSVVITIYLMSIMCVSTAYLTRHFLPNFMSLYFTLWALRLTIKDTPLTFLHYSGFTVCSQHDL